jgi:hypothetical protein
MNQFTVGQEVFPKWSQHLPAFTVVRVGAVTVTIVDDGGNREIMHIDDIVARDPAAHYDHPRYEALR